MKGKNWSDMRCAHLYAEVFLIEESFSAHSTDVEPILFSFRIKFFPADPFRLSGNGKIMLYQQLKRDLRLGRLYCSAGEAAALGSLIVQGKQKILIDCEVFYSKNSNQRSDSKYESEDPWFVHNIVLNASIHLWFVCFPFANDTVISKRIQNVGIFSRFLIAKNRI